MPIMLDKLDINAQIQPKTFSPKFFDTKLTGVGKKTGVLNEMRNPMYVDPAEITRAENRTIRRRHYVSGSTDTTIIPISVLSTEAWDAMDLAPRPDDHKLVKIGSYKDVKGNTGELFVNMDVYSIVLQETRLAYQAGQKNGPSMSKKVTACYSVFLWMVFDKANLKHATTSIPGLSVFNGANTYCVDFTVNPKVYMDKVLHDLSRDPDITMDPDAIKNFIDTYSLYDGVCRASEEWQTAIDKSLDRFFENAGHKRSTYGDNNIMNQTVYILRHIEDYNVPLDLYRQIYSDIMYRFSHDDAVMLCKENLNLLLSDTLNNLEQNKPALTCIPVQNPPVPVPNRAIPFSPEQQRAITSPDPLVLVQAGAGTGKSTVILGRIDWMIDSGIDPNDITVLSFTNAAANNITARNPTIHSMTIASMIHTIYAANFPEHELSTLDTIINSLEIYFGNLDVARKFRELCKAVIKNDPDGFTRMNNFVEQHYDEVMHMLDTIGQVSLELEIIICYQKIETLNEPSSVTSKYLIIDEVQDNSIFEFIYTLKYVDKHKESLFIVGKLRLPTLNPTNCGNTTHMATCA